MSEHLDGPEEVRTTVDDEQRAVTEPLGEKAGGAVGAVSETAGEAVRDTFEAGESEATPWIALSGVMIAVGAVLLVVMTLALVLYFAFGGD
jgi:hypothetical protein